MKHPKPILILLAVGPLSPGAVGLAFGDDDDDDERREGGQEESGWMESRAPLSPVVNAIYNAECGSCHMAYQPGLLPPRAWAEIVTPTALANHYGDDASLTEDLRTEISAFLGASSADLALQGDPLRLDASGSNTGRALPRISATANFKNEHDEIPSRLVAGNPEVGSFSKCNACHRGATEGNYNERQIDIPGHGPWKD
ncbi:diheme cytochrome c [Thiocapsa bogorovii]|uniref:diheme cytochrome c n=1 Tax=Thiocapsa bogorovii TaxID=521689 RepID=UPI001E43B150|nr:diheme cytochrome c [Thiocapsa bogorovii]UHD18500.1 diheme cytochrome c [Thiocapsa bogorovii]